MEAKERVIVVLGGDVVCDKEKWRTTRFFEGDEHGVLGDAVRVAAAAELFKRYPLSSLIIASGGKSKNIFISEVIKQELVELGVSRSAIIEEAESDSTYEQFYNVQAILRKKKLTHHALVSFVTNRYHLARVWAMLRRAPGLNYLLGMMASQYVCLVSAEEVVYTISRQWADEIDRAYASPEMMARIEKEAQGLRQILDGTYKFRHSGV